MNYRFRAEAEAEYLNAVRFYEEQRPGLGLVFIAEFERIMVLATRLPTTWKQIDGIRRIDLRRFPYAVYYHPNVDSTLLVTAIAHHRRRPGYWMIRVS